MVLRITVLVTTVLLVGCNSNSGTSNLKDAGQTQKLTGEELYLQNCKICHGKKGDEGISGAGDLATSTMNKEAIREIIIKGKGNMPPFEYKFKDDSGGLDELIKYVETLRKK